jgi:hypothetical protein
VTTINPYESPRHAHERLAGPTISPAFTIWQATIYVFAMTLVGTFLGGLMGLAIGLIAPDHYRAVISGGNSPGFDPVVTGAILGTTQGLVGGTVLGLFVLAIYVWYLTRLRRIA